MDKILSKFWLFFILITLNGCSAKDDKIVDIAGGVFSIFVILILLKYSAPFFIDSAPYRKVYALLMHHNFKIVTASYIACILLFLIGVSSDGLNRIHIFSAFTLAVISFNFGKLTLDNDRQKQKIHVEIISLGFGVLLVLFLLWTLGFNLFSQL